MARSFFIDNPNIMCGNNLVIVGEEYNHLVNVLRYKEGQKFHLINDTGKKFLSSVVRIDKKKVEIQVVSELETTEEPKINLTVFQALVKGEKFEFLAQKLTELGATKIAPFNSEFCQVKPNTTRLDRLEKISLEACKQCGRSRALSIGNVLSFDEMLQELNNFDIVFFAYEKATSPLEIKPLAQQSIALVIGSEGGFSDTEYQKLMQLPNVKVLSLGTRILRAETAAVMLSSNIMFLSEVERDK